MGHEYKSAWDCLPKKWKNFNKSKAKLPSKLVKYRINDGNKRIPPRNPKHEAWFVQHQRDQGSVNLLVATIKSCLSKVQFLILFMSNIQFYRNQSTTSSAQAYELIDKNVNFSHSSNYDSPSPVCIHCDSSFESSTYWSYLTMPVMKTFKLGSYLVQQVLSTASFLSMHNMKKASKFSLIWDTGASMSISPDKNDFISMSKPKGITTLLGISKGLVVKRKGIVRWNLIDEKGVVRPLEVPALYVPNCKVHLLRPHSVIEKYDDESISMKEYGMKLSGSTNDTTRGSVSAIISKANNLPSCIAFSDKGLTEAATALNASISVVHSSNTNLSQSEKFFLQWHWRLGHPGYNRLMFLFRSGVLSTSKVSLRMIKGVLSSVKHVPKCAACMFGKQRRLPIPGTTTHVVKDRQGIIKANHLNPGDKVPIDHFYCSSKGRLFNSRGKTKADSMYCGG